MRRTLKSGQSGFILVLSMFMIVVLGLLIAAYTTLIKVELQTTNGIKNSEVGFNSAEAGLNLRADSIRSKFLGYNRPSGTSPTATNPCTGSNTGSGDYLCQTYTFGKQTTTTYLTEDASNPYLITVPPGERYQNLTAQEYDYNANATAKNNQNKVEALLELNFKSRLVPLFQFAAFYNKDLEINPGASMTLSGPVFTNGDLYMDSSVGLTIQGQTATAGKLYRGRKDSNSCIGNGVSIYNPTTAQALVTSCAARTPVVKADVTTWNNMIQIGVPVVSVPSPDQLTAAPGATYWDHSDIRLVLRVDNSNNALGVDVRNQDNSTNTASTTALATCTGTATGNLGSSKAVNSTITLYNNREHKYIRMLDIDVRNFLQCLYANPIVMSGKALGDVTDGGLVFHFSVSGPNSSSNTSNYGVRLFDAAQLRATNAAAPLPVGMTIVTDGAVYVQGDYNATNKIPASVLVDTFNVLSNNWSDTNSSQALGNRVPTNTTQQLAVLSATDSTGSTEGSGGQGGAYNGGLENYPRFHENWNSTVTYTYRGSFVSLNTPQHVSGAWIFGAPYYTAPVRNWNYDTSFNAAQNLPPITPRFVYLKQQLFLRDYTQN